MTAAKAISRFRIIMAAFIAGLLVSGFTAFPLLRELQLLVSWLGLQSANSPTGHTGLSFWILTVKFGLADMYEHYPWIAYGTDWLAFGHIAIALFFVGAFVQPSESRLILYAGIAACILVFPLALICEAIRGIPLYWRLIDCSFGALGILPLLYCLGLLKHIPSNVPNEATEPKEQGFSATDEISPQP